MAFLLCGRSSGSVLCYWCEKFMFLACGETQQSSKIMKNSIYWWLFSLLAIFSCLQDFDGVNFWFLIHILLVLRIWHHDLLWVRTIWLLNTSRPPRASVKVRHIVLLLYGLLLFLSSPLKLWFQSLIPSILTLVRCYSNWCHFSTHCAFSNLLAFLVYD